MPLARIAIRPPYRPSNGAQAVREALGSNARIVRRDPLPRQYRSLINWGNAQPLHTNVRVLNKPGAISKAVNKLIAFETMKAGDVSIPVFTTDAPEVQPKQVWLARTKLGGSGGEGIEVVRHGQEVPRAPLYVKYVPKKREFRVHVVSGKAVFLQEKKKKLDVEMDANQRLIRNYDNGWVFTIGGASTDDPLLTPLMEEAVKAVAVLGLDFGAVDCILEKATNKPMILEVNCAPGLESPTLIEAYKQAFTEVLINGQGQTNAV